MLIRELRAGKLSHKIQIIVTTKHYRMMAFTIHPVNPHHLAYKARVVLILTFKLLITGR